TPAGYELLRSRLGGAWKTDRPGQRDASVAQPLQEGVGHVRVELAARATRDFFSGMLGIHGWTIRAGRGHRVKCVRYRHQPAAKGDRRAGEPIWVAKAVPALVVAMCVDGRAHEKRRTRENGRAH